jgi:CBS-domain-containing membrane protein
MTTVTTARTVVAADIMTSPVPTIDQNCSIWEAGDLMLGRRIRYVAVTAGNCCIGVLTDRDILEAWHRGPAALRATPVRRLVAARTTCVLADASLQQVARLMNRDLVDCVPVVDASGLALGIITSGDVIKAVAAHGVLASTG